MRLMWVGCAVAMLTGSAGCFDDPSLKVVVDLAGYENKVVSTRIAVYESQTLTCELIQFGLASSAELQAAIVDDITVTTGGAGALTGLSRENPKLIVATSSDVNGGQVTAGCAEKGEIVGNDEVDVATEAVAQLTVTTGSLDEPFSQQPIEISTADLYGAPIAAREVTWQTFGPAGSYGGTATMTAPNPVCTDAMGNATIHPQDPTTPGPIEAQLQVAWASTAPPIVPGFIAPPTNAVSLTGTAVGNLLTPSPISCVKRRTFLQGVFHDTVVCMHQPDTGANNPRAVVEITADPTTNQPVTRSLGSVANGFALESTPDASGAASDALYGIDTNGNWKGLDGTADGTLVANQVTFATAGAPGALFTVPSCGDTTPGFVMIEFNTTSSSPTFVTFSLTGTKTANQPLSAMMTTGQMPEEHLLGGGCVADITGGIHQVIALSSTTPITKIETNVLVVPLGTGSASSITWTGAAGIGFTTSGELHAIGSVFGTSGTVVAEWVLAADSDAGYHLVVRSSTPTAASPRAFAAGQFDGDALIDLAWTEEFTESTRQSNRVQIALGLQVLGASLSGLSAPLRGTPANLVVADLDGDGRDDIVTFDTTQALVTLSGVSVPATIVTDAANCLTTASN